MYGREKVFEQEIAVEGERSPLHFEIYEKGNYQGDAVWFKLWIDLGREPGIKPTHRVEFAREIGLSGREDLIELIGDTVNTWNLRGMRIGPLGSYNAGSEFRWMQPISASHQGEVRGIIANRFLDILKVYAPEILTGDELVKRHNAWILEECDKIERERAQMAQKVERFRHYVSSTS
jgi:hypothetical protein